MEMYEGVLVVRCIEQHKSLLVFNSGREIQRRYSIILAPTRSQRDRMQAKLPAEPTSLVSSPTS